MLSGSGVKMSKKGMEMDMLVMLIAVSLVIVSVFVFIIRAEITQKLATLPFEEFNVEETVAVPDSCPNQVGGLVVDTNRASHNFLSQLIYDTITKKVIGRDYSGFYVDETANQVRLYLVDWSWIPLRISLYHSLDSSTPAGEIYPSLGREYIRLDCAFFNPSSQAYAKYLPYTVPYNSIPLDVNELYAYNHAFYFTGRAKTENTVTFVPLCKDKIETYEKGDVPYGCSGIVAGNLYKLTLAGEITKITRGGNSIVCKQGLCKTSPIYLRIPAPKGCLGYSYQDITMTWDEANKRAILAPQVPKCINTEAVSCYGGTACIPSYFSSLDSLKNFLKTDDNTAEMMLLVINSKSEGEFYNNMFNAIKSGKIFVRAEYIKAGKTSFEILKFNDADSLKKEYGEVEADKCGATKYRCNFKASVMTQYNYIECDNKDLEECTKVNDVRFCSLDGKKCLNLRFGDTITGEWYGREGAGPFPAGSKSWVVNA